MTSHSGMLALEAPPGMLALEAPEPITGTGSKTFVSVATQTDESTLQGKCCLLRDGLFSCQKKRQRERERERERERDRQE